MNKKKNAKKCYKIIAYYICRTYDYSPTVVALCKGIMYLSS